MNLKKSIKKLFRKSVSVDTLYKENDYLTAYSKHTDKRVEDGPKSAIGGMWEVIGPLQFKFLVHKGLMPEHKMLDIGCGTLRGGQFAIKYLNPTNYSGLDISPKAIARSKEFVSEIGLKEKKPKLIVNENLDLKFKEFEGQKFDYLLAQSVFTHLKPEHITECFEYVGNIMHGESKFYFTFSEEEEYRQKNNKDFAYPYSFFEPIAEKYGFKLKNCSEDYDHPRKQKIVELSKA